jgi:hypothetical protein
MKPMEVPEGGSYDFTGILPAGVPAHRFVWFTVVNADETAASARTDRFHRPEWP